MSSILYPGVSTLPGQSIEVQRSYVWKTLVQEALSGKESALSVRQYPLVHFELTYNVLRDNISPSEIKTLVGLHNAMAGRYDTFLFTYPDFNSVTAQTFGIGDGTTAAFQLVATYAPASGGYAGIGGQEIVQNLNGVPTLFDNGTPISSSNYSIGGTGLVTFGAGHIPAATHVLTWTGNFYYRCRFDEDAITYKRFMNQLWSAVTKFTSTKL